MLIEFEDIKTYVAIAAFIMSIFALFNVKKSRKIAEESLLISKQIKRDAEIEYLKTTPAVDILKVIKVNNTHRVVLLLSNMRSIPFRINSIGLSKKSQKKEIYKTTYAQKLNQNLIGIMNPLTILIGIHRVI